MKIRTIRYMFKEGLSNTYKNKLMSLASITIVILSLLVFGIFALFIFNLNHNTKVLKEQPEMRVYCFADLDDLQVSMVEDSIRQNPQIAEFRKVTKEQALQEVQKMLGDDKDILEGENESFLPVSFIIKLKDPKQSSATVEELKKINGVEKVRYSQVIIDFISKFINWIQIISAFLIIVLTVVSMFIIANTIKLTVFARRKEINIMKYIGATDWFIRWPFVIEGIVIGFLGALIAFILTSYGYNAVEGMSRDFFKSTLDFIGLVKLSDIGFRIVGVYALLGIIIGAIGSLISIRKYLHV